MANNVDLLLDRILAQQDTTGAEKRTGGERVPVRERPVTVRRKKITVQNREVGQDTPRTAKYICGFIDETDRVLYLVGGLGTAEKMVLDLQSLPEPHAIRSYSGPSDNSPREFVRIISKNRRTRYGLKLGEDFNGWEKAVVIKGTADFYFLLHNTVGRQDRVG